MGSSRGSGLATFALIGKDAGAPGIGTFASSRVWGGWFGGLTLVLLCLSVYLPGLWAIPPVDRDESRFAQASRQMWESGDWVVPRVQDRARLNKPPMIYWLQCASIAVFGDRPGQYANGNIWVFRVPSVLAAIGSVLMTWRIGKRMMGGQAACLGAALLAVCPMVVWDAHQARADQVLLLCTTGAMWRLMAAWREGRRLGAGEGGSGSMRVGACAVFWVCVGAGIMTKGPITPMVVGLTALALSMTTQKWRWMLRLRPVMGMVIVGAMVMPWVVAVGICVGWNDYAKIVWDETIGRSAAAKEGHWGPPGYHLVLLVVLMWPGSLMTGLGLARAFRRAFAERGYAPGENKDGRGRKFLSRMRTGDGNLNDWFLLAWIAPSWVVFEVVSTKLPHYAMPLYPALALVSARAVFAAQAGVLRGVRDWGTRVGFRVWWIVGLALTVGLACTVAVTGVLDFPSQREGTGGKVYDFQAVTTALAPYALPGALLMIGLVAAQRSLARGRFVRVQLLSIASTVVWGSTLLQMILPAATRFWIAPRILAAVDLRPQAMLPFVNRTTFTEDSLVFLTRGRVSSGMEKMDQESASIVLLPVEEKDPAGTLRVGGGPLPGQSLGLVRGWNYSTGREVEVRIMRMDGGLP